MPYLFSSMKIILVILRHIFVVITDYPVTVQVGCDHAVHGGLRGQRARHLEGEDHGLLLRHLRHLLLRPAGRHPGLRICLEGSTAAKAEAHESSENPCSHVDPVPLEVLRCGREQHERGDVAHAHGAPQALRPLQDQHAQPVDVHKQAADVKEVE